MSEAQPRLSSTVCSLMVDAPWTSRIRFSSVGAIEGAPEALTLTPGALMSRAQLVIIILIANFPELAVGAAKTACRDRDGTERSSMVRIAVLGLSLIVVGVDAGRAQDIAGIEDCTKTSQATWRTKWLRRTLRLSNSQ
jgi:hypothetical protein